MNLDLEGRKRERGASLMAVDGPGIGLLKREGGEILKEGLTERGKGDSFIE